MRFQLPFSISSNSFFDTPSGRVRTASRARASSSREGRFDSRPSWEPVSKRARQDLAPTATCHSSPQYAAATLTTGKSVAWRRKHLHEA